MPLSLLPASFPAFPQAGSRTFPYSCFFTAHKATHSVCWAALGACPSTICPASPPPPCQLTLGVVPPGSPPSASSLRCPPTCAQLARRDRSCLCPRSTCRVFCRWRCVLRVNPWSWGRGVRVANTCPSVRCGPSQSATPGPTTAPASPCPPAAPPAARALPRRLPADLMGGTRALVRRRGSEGGRLVTLPRAVHVSFAGNCFSCTSFTSLYDFSVFVTHLL